MQWCPLGHHLEHRYTARMPTAPDNSPTPMLGRIPYDAEHCQIELTHSTYTSPSAAFSGQIAFSGTGIIVDTGQSHVQPSSVPGESEARLAPTGRSDIGPRYRLTVRVPDRPVRCWEFSMPDEDIDFDELLDDPETVEVPPEQEPHPGVPADLGSHVGPGAYRVELPATPGEGGAVVFKMPNRDADLAGIIAEDADRWARGVPTIEDQSQQAQTRKQQDAMEAMSQRQDVMAHLAAIVAIGKAKLALTEGHPVTISREDDASDDAASLMSSAVARVVGELSDVPESDLRQAIANVEILMSQLQG